MLLSVFHDEMWLPSCANLRECTMVGYESAWRCHIVDAFGGLEIDSITADMIETWMAGMPRGAARKAWGVLHTMPCAERADATLIAASSHIRTSYDVNIPANTWHAGRVSFPVAAV